MFCLIRLFSGFWIYLCRLGSEEEEQALCKINKKIFLYVVLNNTFFNNHCTTILCILFFFCLCINIVIESESCLNWTGWRRINTLRFLVWKFSVSEQNKKETKLTIKTTYASLVKPVYGNYIFIWNVDVFVWCSQKNRYGGSSVSSVYHFFYVRKVSVSVSFVCVCVCECGYYTSKKQ